MSKFKGGEFNQTVGYPQPIVQACQAFQATPSSNPLQVLTQIRTTGSMPKRGLLWIGLGLLPPKNNAIRIDVNNLPEGCHCRCLAGLDVIVCFKGLATRYTTLRCLCVSIMRGNPRRCLLIDLDCKRTAFIKLGGN